MFKLQLISDYVSGLYTKYQHVPLPSAPPTDLPMTSDPNILALIHEFSDIFPSSVTSDLLHSRITDHHIDLMPGSTPPARRIYRVAHSEKPSSRSS